MLMILISIALFISVVIYCTLYCYKINDIDMFLDTLSKLIEEDKIRMYYMEDDKIKITSTITDDNLIVRLDKINNDANR